MHATIFTIPASVLLRIKMILGLQVLVFTFFPFQTCEHLTGIRQLTCYCLRLKLFFFPELSPNLLLLPSFLSNIHYLSEYLNWKLCRTEMFFFPCFCRTIVQDTMQQKSSNPWVLLQDKQTSLTKRRGIFASPRTCAREIMKPD